MAQSIAGRKVRMFRCERPPLIGGKTLQAHDVVKLGWDAEVNLEATGLIVTTNYGAKHFVAFTNIQNTEFAPEPQAEVIPLPPPTPLRGQGKKGPA